MPTLLNLIKYFEVNIDEARDEIRYEIELDEHKKLHSVKFFRTTFNFFGGGPGSVESELLEYVIKNFELYITSEEKLTHDRMVELPLFIVKECK